jgi:hypothetical protein
MAIKKVVEIDVDVVRANGGLENFTQNFKKSEEAAKSLKTQLREAQLEVATLSDKFGATSREAVEAAKRAADLKDRIGDAKSLTEAFNPDAKFKALSASLTGVAGGFSVVTGLMGTLGTESKEVEGAILKVQSAMAIASGAQAIGESIDSFKQLGAVVKSFSIVQKISAAAQMVWNAAMAANPIGAIVAVVVALIAAGYALVKMFIASSEATQKAEAANKALNKELDTQVKNQKLATQESDLSRDAQLKMAKASGKSSEEIRKLSLELANQEVTQKMTNAQTLRAIAIEAMRVAGMKDATDAEKETAKNALKEFNNANEALKASVLNRRKLIIDNRVAETQEATDAREKSVDAQKKHNDELLANQKKANQERIDEFLRLKRAETDAANQAALDREKADTAFFDKEMEARKNNELSKMTEQEADVERVRLKYEADLEYARKNNLDASALEEEKANAINEINLNAQNKLYADLQEAGEREIALDLAIREAKRNALDTGLNILSQFAGKNKTIALGILAIQKGLAIADIVVGASKSIAAAQSALAATPAVIGVVPNPMYAVQAAATVKGIALTKITAATSIASILAASISQAKSITGGDGGGSAPSMGAGGGSAAPQFNIVGQSSTNQLSQTIAGQQNRPIQTYVVGNQVSTQQSLDRNAVATSTFG